MSVDCSSLLLGTLPVSPSWGEDLPGSDSVAVHVLAGPQYILVAPTDGKVVSAPVAGRIHYPVAPSENSADLVAQKALWDQNGDPTAVAVFNYPNSVYEQIERSRLLALSVDKLLVKYGQRGIEPLVTNSPWLPDVAGKREAQKVAMTRVTGDEAYLKKGGSRHRGRGACARI
jgi:hypothetical protein